MTTFYFDENLSWRLAQMLAALDVKVTHQKQEFPSGMLDSDWIPEIGKRGYVLVTWDRKTRTRPAEAEALRKHGVTTIYLGEFWKKLQFWDQAAWLARHWPKIEEFVTGCDQGTVAEIQQNGKFRYVVLGHKK